MAKVHLCDLSDFQQQRIYLFAVADTNKLLYYTGVDETIFSVAFALLGLYLA